MDEHTQAYFISLLKRHHYEIAVIGAARSAKAEGKAIIFDADMLWAMTTFQVVALNAPDGEWLRAAGEEAGIDVTRIANEIYQLQWEFNYTIMVKLGLEKAPEKRWGILRFFTTDEPTPRKMQGMLWFLSADSHAPYWVLVNLAVYILVFALFWLINFLR